MKSNCESEDFCQPGNFASAASTSITFFCYLSMKNTIFHLFETTFVTFSCPIPVTVLCNQNALICYEYAICHSCTYISAVGLNQFL